MTKRTTVRVPDDLLLRAKRKALAESRSLTALIEDGLCRVLADGAPRVRVERILPPVSSATGGLMPGLSLDDGAALQEDDDFARFRELDRREPAVGLIPRYA